MTFANSAWFQSAVPARGLVLRLDPDLELRALDAPRPGVPDPDGRELARADELVRPRDVESEELRRVGEGEEPAELIARTGSRS